MAIPVPRINGNYFDWSSVVITAAGGRFVGVTELSYSDTVERGGVYGTNRKRIGRTAGQVSNEASITMMKDDAQALMKALAKGPNGYGDTPFLVTASYAERGRSPITDVLVDCVITGVADSHSEGTEALRVALTLDVMEIVRDGLSIAGRVL